MIAPQIVPVYVTNVLRVDGNNLGHDLVNVIFDDLTIPNLAHIKAKERELWGWKDIPEFHQPFDLDGDQLVLPRGYALTLKQQLRKHDIKVRWIDRSTWHKGKPLGRDEFSFRDHQPAALDAIKRHRQGIYKAPTGSGKTAAICSVIWDLSPERTIILVDKKNLITQWGRDIKKHLGIDTIGAIGGGEWTEDRITVATVQTLWSRRYEIDQDWWELFDMMVLDECHHVTARTLRDIVARFYARLRLGASATPDKTGEFALAQAVLGPVFHENTHAELQDAGILIKPQIKVVFSDFKHPYWGDHKANKKGQCEVPDCRDPKPYHKHRNNYTKLLPALVRDESRNGLIVEIIKREADHTVLVCTDQTTQIDAILAAITQDSFMPLDDIYILTGKQSVEERDEIIETVTKRGYGIILSTIANEALNMPAIDRIILAFPTRNAKKTAQQIGRGARTARGKTNCLVYDIADNIGPMQTQLGSRIRDCYREQELDVEFINKPAERKGLGRLASA